MTFSSHTAPLTRAHVANPLRITQFYVLRPTREYHNSGWVCKAVSVLDGGVFCLFFVILLARQTQISPSPHHHQPIMWFFSSLLATSIIISPSPPHQTYQQGLILSQQLYHNKSSRRNAICLVLQTFGEFIFDHEDETFESYHSHWCFWSHDFLLRITPISRIGNAQDMP